MEVVNLVEDEERHRRTDLIVVGRVRHSVSDRMASERKISRLKIEILEVACEDVFFKLLRQQRRSGVMILYDALRQALLSRLPVQEVVHDSLDSRH